MLRDAAWAKNLSLLSKLLISILALLAAFAVGLGPFYIAAWLFGRDGVLAWFLFLLVAPFVLLFYHQLFGDTSQDGMA